MLYIIQMEQLHFGKLGSQKRFEAKWGPLLDFWKFKIIYSVIIHLYLFTYFFIFFISFIFFFFGDITVLQNNCEYGQLCLF